MGGLEVQAYVRSPKGLARVRVASVAHGPIGMAPGVLPFAPLHIGDAVIRPEVNHRPISRRALYRQPSHSPSPCVGRRPGRCWRRHPGFRRVGTLSGKEILAQIPECARVFVAAATWLLAGLGNTAWAPSPALDTWKCRPSGRTPNGDSAFTPCSERPAAVRAPRPYSVASSGGSRERPSPRLLAVIM